MSKGRLSAIDSRRSRAPEKVPNGGPGIACFVSPHGFGHAARAAAVMGAIQQRCREVRFEIFTTVPGWFFEKSLNAPFTLHPVETDVGFEQATPFVQDLEATRKHLDRFLPFDDRHVGGLARQLRDRSCALVICDISPLGIAVGRAAGLPTALIENFTWDWLYEGYPVLAGRIRHHIGYLRRIFQTADVHIQTEPVCAPNQDSPIVGPASRPPRSERLQVRNRLAVPSAKKMVLVTTGGIPDRYEFLDVLRTQTEVVFVLPGGAEGFERRDNLVLLPVNSEFFHPDLVAASDAVVGKVGYSTLAEVHAAGVPFGCVQRSDFRESRVLVEFVHKEMNAVDIAMTDFYNGDWLQRLPELLAMPRPRTQRTNGATQIAELLSRFYDTRAGEQAG
jgi:UDP:flavonoid glycosyltransferase YjiC (YdhE family)